MSGWPTDAGTAFADDGSGFRVAQAPDPVPGRSQALIEVAATSLNFGEVAFGDPVQADIVFGWDAAGRRVLITGAAGGVGRFAVQLAARAGAHVLTVDDAERYPPWRLEQFHVGPPFGPDLGYLVALLERAELDPQTGWRGPWEQAHEAAAALIGRCIAGKVVVDVSA